MDFCCGICFQMYDADFKCPRVLACGHTFCHNCLVEMFNKEYCRTCPYCKAVIRFQKAKNIPCNFALKNVVMASSLTIEEEFRNAIEKLMSEEFSPKEGFIEQFLNRASMIEDIFDNLKDTFIREVQKEQHEQKAINTGLKELIGEVKRKGKHIGEHQCSVKRVKELKSLRTKGKRVSKYLKAFKKTVKNCDCFGDFFYAKNDLRLFLESTKSTMSDDLKVLDETCKSKSVYVVEERFEHVKYGKVAVEKGRIRVYSFETEKPDAILIPFADLLSKFRDSTELPNTAFLKIAPVGHEADDSEVLIETDGLSLRSENFILLCSGLKEYSHKGGLLSCFHPFCYGLWLAPPPQVDFIRYENPQNPMMDGGLYGRPGASAFIISMKDSKAPSPMFGVVVSGMRNLKALAQDATIINCGVII